jgi:hypothetical protein
LKSWRKSVKLYHEDFEIISIVCFNFGFKKQNRMEGCCFCFWYLLLMASLYVYALALYAIIIDIQLALTDGGGECQLWIHNGTCWGQQSCIWQWSGASQEFLENVLNAWNVPLIFYPSKHGGGVSTFFVTKHLLCTPMWWKHKTEDFMKLIEFTTTDCPRPKM